MKRARFAFAALGTAGIGLASAADAHTGTGLAGGFQSGFLHPLSGPDHLLAMISVGLWGAFLGRPLIYLLPVTFPMMMVVGAILGMAGAPLPFAQTGVAASVLILGACVASGARLHVALATAIVAAFAIFHGYAHGRELPSAADPVGYSLGFVLATGLLHVSGILFGLGKNLRHGTAAIRVAGGLIAISGAGFLASAAGS